MRIHHLPILLLALLMLAGCQTQPGGQADPLKVAVAANFAATADTIARMFTEETGIPVQLIVGSSAKLATQIREGAPYDIFLSADHQQPSALHREGLLSGPLYLYCTGRLAVASTLPLDSLRDLLHPRFQKIAYANPDLAPFGKAAEAAMRVAGIYDSLAPRLVQGESVQQVNTYLTTGVVQAAFTSRSFQPGGGSYRMLVVPAELHATILQSGCITRHGGRALERCQHFMEFLAQPKAKAVMLRHGYEAP